MNAVATSYKILYNNKDITLDISDHLISLSYTDKVEGESDELEITLEDKDLLWQNDWYPEKGATIEARIIDNGVELNCGKFTIDEVGLSGSKDGGDTVVISCVAASITKKLRTKKNTAHENKTLDQLAESVATANGLTVQGNIPAVSFKRITQARESDLAFLNRIANQFGLIFSVRDTLLIFQDQKELESKVHVVSIDKTECTEYSFTDKSNKTYKSAKVKYHNPKTNTTIDHTESADSDYEGGDDELAIKQRAETQQQAELMGKGQLNKANKNEKTAKITTPGNILILSGSNIEVTGFGKPSGIYHITEASHTVSRDGYGVSFDGKKVKIISSGKYKPKRKSSSDTGSIITGVRQVAPEIQTGDSLGDALQSAGTGFEIVHKN